MAGPSPGGPPSAGLPCPGPVWCLPSLRGPWVSAASDPSPAHSASLKTALWMGAALILCTGGWAARLQHPTCSSSPRQLSSPLLFPCALGSLIFSTWDFFAGFTLCPNMVPLAALGTRGWELFQQLGAPGGELQRLLCSAWAGTSYSLPGADATHSPGRKAFYCCWIKELGWPTEGPGGRWVSRTSAFWQHQALTSAPRVGELQPHWLCLS